MTTTRDLTADVRELVTKHFVYHKEAEPLTDNDSLLESGLIDSTGILELLLLLENTFGIRIADDEVVPANLDSIGRIAAYVGRKTGADPGVVRAG